MNAYEVENLMRSWLMAVAYTAPHKIVDLDLRINCAGCDVADGDFIKVTVMVLDDRNPAALNVYRNEAHCEFTGTRLSSVQMSGVTHNLMQYWERLK